MTLFEKQTLHAQFNLLGLEHAYPNVWYVHWAKTKLNMSYCSALTIYSSYIKYRQKDYYQTDFTILFKRIANDIKGII